MNGELDYGEGKTREEDARDSTVMLGVAILVAGTVLFVTGLTAALLWIIF